MTPRQFDLARRVTRMPEDSATTRAARKVLVEGATAYAAAKTLDIHESAVGRAVKRLRAIHEAGVCPCCGQRLR